jgi:hypothetical protein
VAQLGAPQHLAQKRMELVAEINSLLEEKERRLGIYPPPHTSAQ